MTNTFIKELGEHIPGKKNTIALNSIKEFVTVPYYVDWYRSKESNKVFSIFLQEISDLNPTNKQIPGVLTKNPFFDHTQIKFFIAYYNNKPAGRIMAYIDYNYNKTHGEKIGWLGLFESIESSDIAEMLLETGIKYLKGNGCTKITGPAKFNANGEVGLLVEGFDKSPYFMEPYNAPYYAQYFEKYGFKKENDWFSMNTDYLLSNGYMTRIENLMEKMNGTVRNDRLNGFNIRNIDFKNIKSEIKIIKDLYNPIWGKGNHPQFTEMTKEEFDILALGIKAIALEELIFVVEKDGCPVGISVSVPNINEIIIEHDINNLYMPSKKLFSLKDLKRDLNIFGTIKKRLKSKKFSGMRVLILGVDEKYRKTGVDSKLYYKTAQAAKALGIKHGSGSQLADKNFDILNPLFKIGKVAMTWRVYELKI
ncbi:MAG: GNAT family N-acetyltransferase [Candidatus Humimicrobiaceae bacterium]